MEALKQELKSKIIEVLNLEDIAIEDIREELENYTTFVSADTLASVEYDKANLSIDATAKIDLEDRLISSPKITVDYSRVIIDTMEKNETDAIKLRADIIKDIVEVRKIVNTTPDISEESGFSSSRAFIEMFKKVNELTPKQYRDQCNEHKKVHHSND